MYKMKTKKSASKRFSFTASGKLKRNKANKQHILTKKAKNRKNRLKKRGYVHPADVVLVSRCLPNG